MEGGKKENGVWEEAMRLQAKRCCVAMVTVPGRSVRNLAPCIWSTDSYPLDHQGRPKAAFSNIDFVSLPAPISLLLSFSSPNRPVVKLLIQRYSCEKGEAPWTYIGSHRLG